jgi:hypothetical protein
MEAAAGKPMEIWFREGCYQPRQSPTLPMIAGVGIARR